MSCNHIRFIGGGRWATIVLSELVKLFPDVRVDWVCHSHLVAKKKFIKNDNIYNNVFLISRENIGQLKVPDKIVIASHSSQHCLDFIDSATHGVDILVEKPLFYDFSDFHSLNSEFQSRVFFNLEFYNAFFLQDFRQMVQIIPLEKISIIWLDPLGEERKDEAEKFSEIYSSIFNDQLLHVLSICKALNLDVRNVKNLSVDSKSPNNLNGIDITYDLDDIAVTVSLSRFADKRERRIVLNSGVAELDFTTKPYLYQHGQLIKELTSSERMYPISHTLNNFLNQPEGIGTSQLSLKALMPEVELAFKCEALFIKNILDSIDVRPEAISGMDSINPDLVYFLGIMYYRYICDCPSQNFIHFLKGDTGVRELIKWWVNSGYSGAN